MHLPGIYQQNDLRTDVLILQFLSNVNLLYMKLLVWLCDAVFTSVAEPLNFGGSGFGSDPSKILRLQLRVNFKRQFI